MANAGVQLLGFILAFIGFVGIIAATIMVQWKASAYVGDNIITAQAMYEGLWQTLSVSAGNVQGTRGLMVSSIVLCFISILVAVMGMKCTTAMSDSPDLKDKVALRSPAPVPARL